MTNNDRELLKFAAIARGELHGEWIDNEAYFEGVLRRWNPLENDGDAFRLMVALANKCEDFHSVIWSWTHRDIRVFAGGHEGFGKDECAKLRYAIVQAAAEFGKSLMGKAK